MRILHLEDSANDALLTESLLRAEWPDCAIINVSRREEYHAVLHRGGFDLILSDYAMPDFDGLAALELARAACPEKPFIFMSGTLGEERAIEALQRGATDYIIKDRPGRLIPAVRLALARAEEIGRRRQTEEALRQNQERFRAITENVADMIAVLELDGRSSYYNPAYRDLFGDTAELPAIEPFSRIHPEDRARVRAVFDETIRTGAKYRTEYRYVLADGSVHSIEAAGSVIRDAEGRIANVLVVARDITERKRSEEHVRQLAALLEKAQDAIYVRDLDQRITYWNPGAERLYGWKASEVLGRRAFDLFYRAETPELLEIRRTVLTKGEWSGELRQFDRRGREVIVLARRTLLRDGEGRPVSILNLNTDVTEQRQLQAQLLRNQRLESIGTLTGGIAHDLNNVLSPIVMGASLLGYAALDESARKTVESIATSAQHGTALVRQLLAFARGTEGKHALVQPKVLLGDVEVLLRQTLPRTIQLSIACAPDCWPVMADATQIQQVVVNLCINARDATPEGGRITISAQNVVVDEDLARRLPDGRPGPHLRISVADNGAGIPAEIIEKIFDPFFTTKAPGKGTGLGLSTVRGIAKGHDGFMQVESRLGHGATFHLYLPMFTPVAIQEETPAAPAVKPAAGHGETVLLVDDDDGIRDLMQTLLELHGFKIITAADGREGAARFRENAERVAVVITDWQMPVMNGAELVAAIHALRPSVPIIALTGLGALDSRAAAGSPAPVLAARLSKPIDTAALLAALRRALAPKA